MYLKQTFLSTTKFRGAQKCFVGHCPRISPVWLRAWDHRQRKNEEENEERCNPPCLYTQSYRYADCKQAINTWYCSCGSFNSVELPKLHARFSIHVLDNGHRSIFLSQCHLTKCLNCLLKIGVISGDGADSLRRGMC